MRESRIFHLKNDVPHENDTAIIAQSTDIRTTLFLESSTMRLVITLNQLIPAGGKKAK